MNNLNLLVTLYMDHYQRDNQSVNRDMFNNITWSPYDRIVFTEAQSLKELCIDNYFPAQHSEREQDFDNNKNDSAWTGVKQCMHLIEERFESKNPYSSNWTLQSNKDNDEKRKSLNLISNEKSIFTVTDLNENGDTVKMEYAFHCIYSMRFSEEIQNLRKGDQIYDKMPIRKEIFEKVRSEAKEKKLDFRCFRSLGSEDMVIIFLANSMKDIVTTVNYINSLKIELPAKLTKTKKDETVDLFSTVCVFSGFNDPEYSKETDLDLIIHLNLKHNNSQHILNELRINEKSKI